jgi:hypothetical protein
MKFLSYEPLALVLFKLFKRGIKSEDENDNDKKNDRDSEKNLSQDKQAQRIRGCRKRFSF